MPLSSAVHGVALTGILPWFLVLSGAFGVGLMENSRPRPAVIAEHAIEVTDLAMKVCGGAAFRRELGIGVPSGTPGPLA